MLETFKLLDGPVEIGLCEGIRSSDKYGNFVVFSPDYYQSIQPGNTLIDDSGHYLQLQSEFPIVEESELKAFKMYYQ